MTPKKGIQAAILALLILPGCAARAPDRLVVATTWPAEERTRLETEFQRWVAASPDLGQRRFRLRWLCVAAQDDPVKLARRASPPQVFLGGGGALVLLESMKDRGPNEPTAAGAVTWCTITRRAQQPPARAGGQAREAWNDPRRDPASLGRAISQLSRAGWREGYAQLIRAAAVRERLGRSSQDSVEAPAVEAAVIAPTAGRDDLAAGFLRFLCETQGATAGGSLGAPPKAGSFLVSSLVADLLGSTMVDAQDELWTAWRALETLSDREKALGWLVEPPPWPPASVAKYLGREDGPAMALLETLSAELAPEPPARAWLKRSWLSSARVVDQKLFEELTQAAEGRLCRESRFRAWLREEWTAWARQRYRRVARWAGSHTREASGERTTSNP